MRQPEEFAVIPPPVTPAWAPLPTRAPFNSNSRKRFPLAGRYVLDSGIVNIIIPHYLLMPLSVRAIERFTTAGGIRGAPGRRAQAPPRPAVLYPRPRSCAGRRVRPPPLECQHCSPPARAAASTSAGWKQDQNNISAAAVHRRQPFQTGPNPRKPG